MIILPQNLVIGLARAQQRDRFQPHDLVQTHDAAVTGLGEKGVGLRTAMSRVVNSTMRRPLRVSMPSTATCGPLSLGG